MSTARQSSVVHLGAGPIHHQLAHQERIDWHQHTRHQLIYPSLGVLQVSTSLGAWVVPPQRAVWIPAGVAHAHQAHGPTEMRMLAFETSVNPLRIDQPTVLAVSPLLREVIISLTQDQSHQDTTDSRRRTLEQVALDQLRRVDELPLCLPAPTDSRLRHIAEILTADMADQRTLAALGAAVGASERTLSRLFQQQTGMSFPQWRAQLRLHRSLTLLTSGESVATVAHACGYGSPSSFIHAFRQAFGTTPGRYRERSAPPVTPPARA